MDAAFIESALGVALASGYLAADEPVAAFVDCDGLRETISSLHSAFPPHFRHAFAAKANPMKAVLELVRDQGMACEVASPGNSSKP